MENIRSITIDGGMPTIQLVETSRTMLKVSLTHVGKMKSIEKRRFVWTIMLGKGKKCTCEWINELTWHNT
uniref:Ovule protein n=1 Tax=Panagrellus redivivus TaxID=6233 RepID=A0A7E4VZG8_PANRE